MEHYFQKNIELLKVRSRSAGFLEDRLPDRVTVLNTRSGEVTIKYGDRLIHSAYDPVKEGHTFAKKVKRDSHICLYGFGLGYHIGPLLEKIGPDGSLLVIELNADILTAAMILRDQTDLLCDDRFHLISGTDETEVATEISTHMGMFRDSRKGHEPVVLFYSPSFKSLPPKFEQIANALEILLMERRVPAVFGDLEEKNHSLNESVIIQSPGIRTLRNAHVDQPALLVNAGPSLDDCIPYLKFLTDEYLVTCVDTAFPILTQTGIQPKYVFTLDPQHASFSYFADNLDSPATLIYTPTANSKIVHCYEGEKIVVCMEGHSLMKEKPGLMKEKGTTPAGGSVSCLGLDCLIQMGCNPIVLMGQDCGFPEHRTYSRYSIQEERLQHDFRSAIPISVSHLENVRQKKQVKVAGYLGQDITTNQVLYSYLRNIEQIAQVHPETRIYNLRSHGARIDHVPLLGSINYLAQTPVDG